MLRGGKNILSGRASRAALHALRQRAPRQNGSNTCGRQQFRCRACGACRVLQPKRWAAAPERQAEVLRATNHAKRFFCTLRQRLGRFVRKTLSFSKCDRMHELALRLFIHHHNQQPIS